MPPMTDAEERWRALYKPRLTSMIFEFEIMRLSSQMQEEFRRKMDRAQPDYDTESPCGDWETPVDDIIRQLKELTK